MKQEVTTTLKVRFKTVVAKYATVRSNGHERKLIRFRAPQCGYQSDDDRIGAMNLYQLGLEYLKGTEHPRIQSPSGKPGDGGCSQSPRDVTSRRKAGKGRSYDTSRNACTTGESQAH